jgi:Cysteine-rich CWC
MSSHPSSEQAPGSVCPACGSSNQCVMAQAQISTREPSKVLLTVQEQKPCWCTQVQFSQELLQKLKVQHPFDQCLCSACLEKFKSTHSAQLHGGQS